MAAANHDNFEGRKTLINDKALAKNQDSAINEEFKDCKPPEGVDERIMSSKSD